MTNITPRTQAIVLLSVGLLLSPAIYLVVSLSSLGGLSQLMAYTFYLLPAFLSIMCLTFGTGRLIASRKQRTGESLSGKVANGYQQKKNNLIALIMATILLGVVGLAMVIIIIRLAQEADAVFVFIVPGAIPIAVVLFALIMLPINIKNILKQKKALRD